MKNKLVIVESPSKAKTIEKYLGKNFKVVSTKGHIMDLPKSSMGIDIENNFEPKYIKVRKQLKLIKELQEVAKKMKEIYLASDNDREGEAIAYHAYLIIKEAIEKEKNKSKKDTDKIKKKNASLNKSFKRVVFNEITENVIKEAIENPRELDINKIDSQKARRVLDRLVGYSISPILWKKVKRGLSAGRVQTVALRFIVEREREREVFKKELYWKIKGLFKNGDIIEAEASKYKNKKIDFKNKELIDEIIDSLKDEKNGIISNIKTTNNKIKKKPPYITATLQQEAFSKFNFNSKKTMRIAQTLYEGVDLDKGRIGLITYMRTDSTRISTIALESAKKFIIENYGEENFDYDKKLFRVDKNFTQDAHEAIRPTDVYLTPSKVKKFLTPDQYKLYTLIWERFTFALMTPPEISTQTVYIKVNDTEFIANFKKLFKKGYYKYAKVLKPTQKFVDFKNLEINDKLNIEKIELEEKETEPPKRYDEASLIKKLKESGIGRPSTYAPTISTLQDRNYIVKENRKLVPTKIGRLVVDLLLSNFQKIFEYDFTANMEKDLDLIEQGQKNYVSTIKNFWNEFNPQVESFANIKSVKDQLKVVTGIKCPACGSDMIYYEGRYGPFLGCSNFPKCKTILNLSYGICPECKQGFIVKRKGKKKFFYGCSRYPECNWTSLKKIDLIKCPECGNYMVNIPQKNIIKCINKDCGYEIKLEND